MIIGSMISMPFGSWPKNDQELWNEAANPGSFAVDITPLGTWSRRHQDLARYAYSMWLGFLKTYSPETLDETPGARATPDRVRRFVERALDRLQPQTVAVAIVNLKGVLESLAPDVDYGWMKPIMRRLEWRARATPPAPKPFCHASVLLSIGEELILGARDDTQAVIDPTSFRDGLMIALLATVPVRIHAFSCIRIGCHLRQQGTGAWSLDWKDETKGRREDHWFVPIFLASPLETYLREARPALDARKPKARPATEHLWIGDSGVPIGDQTIRKIIKRRTAETRGAPIKPHAFRTSAATTFVLENPEHAIEASALLAHRDFRTTERHYLAGRRQMAIRIAHDALKRVRRNTPSD